MIRLFIDSNVLFTAAHNPEGKASLVTELAEAGNWEVVTSAYCIAEARLEPGQEVSDGSWPVVRDSADSPPCSRCGGRAVHTFPPREGSARIRLGATMQGNAFSHGRSTSFRPIHEQTEGYDGDRRASRRRFPLGYSLRLTSLHRCATCYTSCDTSAFGIPKAMKQEGDHEESDHTGSATVAYSPGPVAGSGRGIDHHAPGQAGCTRHVGRSQEGNALPQVAAREHAPDEAGERTFCPGGPGCPVGRSFTSTPAPWPSGT